MIKAISVTRQRTEEERLRRHLYGDKGARFASRHLVPGSAIMQCLTTVPAKDNLICVFYEEDSYSSDARQKTQRK